MTQTADEAANETKVKLDRQIKELEWAVDRYWGELPCERTNWAQVGSLGHLSELLDEALDFIGRH